MSALRKNSPVETDYRHGLYARTGRIQPMKNIYDLRKVKDWKKRLRIAVRWFPKMAPFAKNVFPEIFEDKK